MTPARAQVAGAILLALAAGCVDAVSFIVLRHTFTANMTGNSTQLGISAARAGAESFVPLVVAVGTFIGSVALATAAIELAARRGLRATAAPALAVEAALLAVFMVAGRHILRHDTVPGHTLGGFYLLLTVAVVAMGIQTAVLTKALGTTIRTTYVSGLITTFSQELVNVLAPRDEGRPSYLRDELKLGSRRESVVGLAVHVAVWAAFVSGAVWGAWAESRWSSWALALPIGAVVAGAAVDLGRPVHRETAKRRRALRREPAPR